MAPKRTTTSPWSSILPRNNPELDTVEEILHIRGFAELLEGVNLEAVHHLRQQPHRESQPRHP